MKVGAEFRSSGISTSHLEELPDVSSEEFWEEDFFHQVLALERKRAERSGNPALLLKLDFRNFPSRAARDACSRTINLLLPTITRGTDVVGWYKTGAILGVLFTELGDSELTDAKEKILKKVQDAFVESLGAKQLKMLGITFNSLESQISWHSSGSGHLQLQPAETQPTKSCLRRCFEIGKLPLKKAWFLMLADLLLVSFAHFVAIHAIPRSGCAIARPRPAGCRRRPSRACDSKDPAAG